MTADPRETRDAIALWTAAFLAALAGLLFSLRVPDVLVHAYEPAGRASTICAKRPEIEFVRCQTEYADQSLLEAAGAMWMWSGLCLALAVIAFGVWLRGRVGPSSRRSRYQ